MADEIKNSSYKVSSGKESASTEFAGAANNGSYAQSGTTFGQGVKHAIEDTKFKNNLDATYGWTETIINTAQAEANIGLEAYKLSMAEKGFVLTLARGKRGGEVGTYNSTYKKYISGADKQGISDKEEIGRLYETKTDIGADRTDTTNPFVFSCDGTYFLPLNFDYTVNAKKQTASSQLVDGAAIIEHIARLPKSITVNFRVIPTTPKTYENDSMRVVEQLVASRNMTNSLANMINYLYEQHEVFSIENDYLNKIMRIQYVFLESYDFRPAVGTDIINITMRLTEVYTNTVIVFEPERAMKSSQ